MKTTQNKILGTVNEERVITKGPSRNVIQISMEIKAVHYMLLKLLAAQWNISIPELLELFVEKMFSRDYVKIKTIVDSLWRDKIGIFEIQAYLLSGERNEQRIKWLHNLKKSTRSNEGPNQ